VKRLISNKITSNGNEMGLILSKLYEVKKFAFAKRQFLELPFVLGCFKPILFLGKHRNCFGPMNKKCGTGSSLEGGRL
jgi:hypothetical protein